jgi:signal transduction histidine kinase
MHTQDKTREHLRTDSKPAEFENQELKKAGTNSKKFAETLHLERDLYADLANALPSGIYRLRVFKEVSLIPDNWLRSKDAPYSVEFANDRFFEILHLDRNAYFENPGIIHDLIFEADRVEFARLNVESNMHTIPFSWEGRLVVDNKLIWIHFKSIPRVLENGDIIWTGTLDDITSRKQTEEEIQQKNAELQKLNADKDYFMSILAHDLKSPFNSILGYLDLLENDLRNYDLDEIEKQIAIVNHSAKSAFNLLEDILLWAMSQSGKIQFVPKEFNLTLTCDPVIEMLKPNADKKNISITVIDTKEITVYADMNMLNTILRNLISNAIKFTKYGGSITIHAEQNDSGVTISVSDNGIGIPSNILSGFFDTGQRYSSRGTANEKGTGLGIMLCKEFVGKHGGRIWVDSEMGKGSTFKFTLPSRLVVV